MENTNHRYLEAEPLSCKIDHGQLIIRIGVDLLADACQRFEPFNVYDENKRDWRDAWVITDKLEFAKDVARQLNSESEIGSTMLTDLLEKAAEQALEYGSLGAEEGEPQWPEELDQDEL